MGVHRNKKQCLWSEMGQSHRFPASRYFRSPSESGARADMAAFTLRAITKLYALQQRGSYSINSLAVESCPTPRHGSTSGERVDLLENFDLGH